MLSDDEAVSSPSGCSPPDGWARQRGRRRGGSAAEDPPRPPHHAALQVEALEATLGFRRRTVRRTGCRRDTVLQLADAIRRRRRARLTYRSNEGVRSQREVSPYGLVVHSGR